MEVGDFHWADSALADLEQLAAAADDRILGARALVLRLKHQLQVDPHVNTDALVVAVEGAVELFDAIGDELGLAKAWACLSWIPWMRCQAAAAEQALARAVEHARRAGDRRTEHECLAYLLGTGLFGPLPVAEAVKRCQRLIATPDMPTRATAHRTLAVLRAMEGSYEEARRHLAEDRAILADIGFRYLAAAGSVAYAAVETFAGDTKAAEHELRQGYATLERMGETSGLSTAAAHLAEVLFARGELESALQLAEIAEKTASADDLQTLVPARGARAKALATRGEIADAEQVARDAVALAHATDWLNLHADGLVSLAHVLRLAGNLDEAHNATEEALRLYERKGNRVSAARARAALTGTLAPA